MAPTQRSRGAPASLKNSIDTESKSSSSKKEVKQSYSFLFILFVGFAVLLAYTIWSSIQTYSNTMVHDMD
jgi:hypothetical protein